MESRTPYTTSAVRLVCLSAVIGLTGCFSLGRGVPVQQHYVLGAHALQEGAASTGHPDGLSIGVRRPMLASYLDSPFIVVRQGMNQIRFAEFHRWGESLDGGISRAVAASLTTRAPIRIVDVAPWPAQERYDYLIQLHVLHFEGEAPLSPGALTGGIRMRVRWEIIQQQGGVVLARGTTEHQESGWRIGDYSQLVTSLDAGLNALSDDLATAVQELASGVLTPLSSRR